MTEPNVCTHGYAPHERRHCVYCAYNDEIAEKDAEIEALKTRLEQAQIKISCYENVLYDILEDADCALSTRETIAERCGIHG